MLGFSLAADQWVLCAFLLANSHGNLTSQRDCPIFIAEDTTAARDKVA